MGRAVHVCMRRCGSKRVCVCARVSVCACVVCGADLESVRGIVVQRFGAMWKCVGEVYMYLYVCGVHVYTCMCGVTCMGKCVGKGVHVCLWSGK